MKISMKRYLTLLGCALALLCPPVIAQGEPADDDASAVEPDSIKQALEEAEAKLQEEIKSRQTLDGLVLPENPTRAQCESYIKEIRRFGEEDSGISGRDPHIEKLSKLPVEHIDLLMREIGSGVRTIRFHAYMAVSTYEPESYRQLAIDGLASEPTFIYLIARHGWYQQAKEPILAKLKAVDPKVAAFDPIWFQAFLEVIEPEHYPLVHEIVLSLYDLGNRLQLLETLPDYDFAKTVNACWEKAKQPDENGKEKTAVVLAFMRDRPVKVTDTLRPYAIRTGQIDAFDPLIEQLNPERGLVSRRGETLTKTALNARLTLRRHLDFNGTNEEIQAWFRTHRDQLVFNPFTQRFELPED